MTPNEPQFTTPDVSGLRGRFSTGCRSKLTGLLALRYDESNSTRRIYSIFPALTPTDAPGKEDPISEKKFNKEDAHWYVMKEVPGYDVNGENHTIQLPAPKPEALLKEL
jgi:hypothetical protein